MRNEKDREFQKFLNSIGGLESGWRCEPHKNSQPFKYYGFKTLEFLKVPERKNPFRLKVDSRDYFSVGSGWLPLIQNLITELIKLGWDKQVIQVKEKFGGLRFYIGVGSTEIFNVIQEYEEKSFEICEVCGEDGKPRSGGWIRTLCDEHVGSEN